MTPQNALKLIFAALFFLFGTISLFAEGNVICRAYSIEGMDAPNVNAKAIIGSATTTNKDKIRLYVEYVNDGFYLHSNFCTGPCSKDNFPTKIFVSSKLYEENHATLEFLLEKIMYAQPEDSLGLVEARSLLANQVQVFVDTSVFDANGTPRLDLSAAHKVAVVSGAEKKTLATEVFSFKAKDQKPTLASKILGCCLSGVPPMAANRILAKLKATPVNVEALKIASFVADTATSRALSSGSQTSKRMLGVGHINNDSTLANAFSNAKGSNLLLLGHVEDTRFVVRSANNQIQFSVEFAKLRQLARNNNVNVAFIGCKTAREIAADTLGAGVIGQFNTVKAVERLDLALKDSTNLADFLAKFSSEEIKIVLTSDFADKAQDITRVADVYAKATLGDFWVKVAQFFFIKNS